MAVQHVHEIDFFRGAAADDVAVLTSIAGEARPQMIVCRATAETCHEKLLNGALAAAGRAELRYRLAGLPFSGAALLVHAAGAVSQRGLTARVGGRLGDRDALFVAEGGMGASELALLRSRPGPASEAADLAKWAALGVFASIERLLVRRLGKPLAGASVIVQGLGAVGMALCELVDAAGAVLIVSDPRRERLRQATLLFNAIPIAPERLATATADVLAPCAPDAPITAEAAAMLNVRLVAGAADGQLADSDAADILHDRGVLCAPDFVVNAGAAIAAAAGRLRLDPRAVGMRVRGIAERLDAVLDHAEMLNLPPAAAARDLAHRADPSPVAIPRRALA